MGKGPDGVSFWSGGVTLIPLHGQQEYGTKIPPGVNPVSGLPACGGQFVPLARHGRFNFRDTPFSMAWITLLDTVWQQP